MACSTYTLSAIAKGCKDNSGGVKVIYICDADAVSAITSTTAETISNIVMSGTAKFAKWEFAPQTATFTSTGNISEENQTVFFQTDLSLVFGKAEEVKRLQIQAATMGYTRVIVEDMNGKFWYLGYDNPVAATAAGADFGTALGDRNALTITLSDFSKALPMVIDMDASALAAIGVA